MWAIGSFVILLALIFMYFLVVVGINYIKDPGQTWSDGHVYPGWAIATGIVLILLSVVVGAFAFVFCNTLLEMTELDWLIAGLLLAGTVAFVFLLVSINMIRGLSFSEALGVVIHRNSYELPEKVDPSRRIKGILLLVAAVVIGVVFAFTYPSMFGEDKEDAVCSVCHRTFAEGSGNASSIARSNMCENCHDNFEWRQEVQDYIDDQPID